MNATPAARATLERKRTLTFIRASVRDKPSPASNATAPSFEGAVGSSSVDGESFDRANQLEQCLRPSLHQHLHSQRPGGSTVAKGA